MKPLPRAKTGHQKLSIVIWRTSYQLLLKLQQISGGRLTQGQVIDIACGKITRKHPRPRSLAGGVGSKDTNRVCCKVMTRTAFWLRSRSREKNITIRDLVEFALQTLARERNPSRGTDGSSGLPAPAVVSALPDGLVNPAMQGTALFDDNYLFENIPHYVEAEVLFAGITRRIAGARSVPTSAACLYLLNAAISNELTLFTSAYELGRLAYMVEAHAPGMNARGLIDSVTSFVTVAGGDLNASLMAMPDCSPRVAALDAAARDYGEVRCLIAATGVYDKYISEASERIKFQLSRRHISPNRLAGLQSSHPYTRLCPKDI